MPGSENGSLAAWLAKSVAQGVIGNVAGQLIGAPVLDFFDLGDSSQQQFQNAVLSRLDQIQGTLKDVQVAVQEIHAVAAETQHALQRYATSAAIAQYFMITAVIGDRYALYADDITAVSKGDRDTAAAALADLRARLVPPNDETISDTMDNVQALLFPESGAVLSLFDLVLGGMKDAMTAVAENAGNYAIPDAGFGFQGTNPIPTDDGMSAGRRMLTGELSAASDYLVNVGVPLFRHIAATGAKGLILLKHAWAGGIHDDRLKDYVMHVLAQIDAMKRFFSEHVSVEVAAAALANLDRYGKRLKGTGVTGDALMIAADGQGDPWPSWMAPGQDLWSCSHNSAWLATGDWVM